MREHELDLIADLVAGRLQDETEALELIASSPELRVEYEAQQKAHDALSAAGPVSLTEQERAALHRDVWTELRAGAAPAATATSPWYLRWAPALGGLFVLIGVVAVINQGGGEGVITAQDGGSATTVLTDEATANVFDLEESADDGDDSAEDDPVPEATEPTASGETADPIVPAAPPPSPFYSEVADMIRAGEPVVPQSRSINMSPEELTACLEQAGLTGYEVYGVYARPPPTSSTSASSTTQPAATTTEGEPEGALIDAYIAAIPEGADVTTAAIVFVDLPTCEVVHVDE